MEVMAVQEVVAGHFSIRAAGLERRRRKKNVVQNVWALLIGGCLQEHVRLTKNAENWY